MSRAVEISLWVVAVVVPVVVVAVGLGVLLRPRARGLAPKLEGVAAVGVPTVSTAAVACGATPRACELADPGACNACGPGWTCQVVGANDTDLGLEGSFCLPARPTSACASSPSTSDTMRGVWRWSGWGGVNVQQWTCACPYPQLYPMDLETGACVRSSGLCRGGTWTYPTDPSLAGANPWVAGKCTCDLGDKLVLGSTGLPECRPDTCATVPRCTTAADCPGTATCETGVCRATCDTDQDCGNAGQCRNGTCTWGVWRADPVPPFTTGSCECPAGCVAVGSACRC